MSLEGNALGHSPQWYAALGAAAKFTGTASFYERLLTLFGAAIPHDYGFAVRYTQRDATEVLHTTGHPEFIVDEYRETYHHFDPFGSYWRKTLRKGLITSKDAIDETPESRVYTGVFQKRARIEDEIGLIFPFPGRSCIGLFLENSGQRFSDGVSDYLGALYPALEGLHSAHLARSFGKLVGLLAEDQSIVIPPVMIVNRGGDAVYRSASWREAEDLHPGLLGAALRRDIDEQSALELSSDISVKVARLPDDFSLAAGGRLVVLHSHIGETGAGKELTWQDRALGPLTKLESDVLALVLKSLSTGQIAVSLQLSKGTVKNYKQRLYKKFGVNSERELFGLLSRD